MKMTRHEYYCDDCGKTLKTSRNFLDIMKSIYEGRSWKRIHVEIVNRHGLHNDAINDRAELCKTCTIKILEYALDQISKGVRASAGTESPVYIGWDEV